MDDNEGTFELWATKFGVHYAKVGIDFWEPHSHIKLVSIPPEKLLGVVRDFQVYKRRVKHQTKLMMGVVPPNESSNKTTVQSMTRVAKANRTRTVARRVSI